MKRILLVTAAMLMFGTGLGRAASLSDNGRIIAGCINAAADVYRLPPAVLVILLGRVSQNTNATVDIGPMQVNQIWIPQVAAHWHATEAATFRALRDDFCANVEAGSWILRQGLDEARGDFWQGVGYYHSHDPRHKATYLQAVLKQVLRLRASVDRQAANRPAPEGHATVAQQPPTVLVDGN